MTIILILFFVSLLGIAIMIGRKLVLLQTGTIPARAENEPHPFVPDLEKVKEVANRNAKRYGYLATVIVIRFYVRSSNFLKSKSRNIREKIKSLIEKNKNGENGQTAGPQEVNKFLRMVSDYKHKLRGIKHRIKEEEERK